MFENYVTLKTMGQISHKHNYVVYMKVFYNSTIANMAILRNSEIECDKFNLDSGSVSVSYAQK
jgi:hypothetical protein